MNESNTSQATTLELLAQENASLREKLGRSRSMTRELLNELFPYERLSEAEMQAYLEPSEGESIQDVLAGFRSELSR